MMNNVYFLRFKRHFFWNFFSITKKYKVIGHALDKESDKMVLYFEDGSLKEIVKWKNCQIELGTDWVLAAKKKMENEIGQTIPLKVYSSNPK